MKKTRLLLMLACSLFVVTAQAKTYQVGVALANFDLNFVSILRSQMARELVAQQLQGQFVDAKGDVALQVQQVDDLINQGVDAIILNPVDTQGVQPMIAAAQRAAIPLIFVNRKPEVPLSGATAYVGSDSALSGRLQMEALAKKMNYRGNVAILMGALSNEETRERTRAVEAVIAKHKELKVIDEVADRAWNYVAVGCGRDLQWWKEFFSVVRMMGYNDWVSLEMEDLTMSVDAGIASSVQALQQTLSQ
ncbi:TPA: substrate-binding domain-containing protein [Serratia marcescens]